MFGSSLNHMIEHQVRSRVPFGRVLEVGPGRAWPGLRLLRTNPDLDLVAWGYDAAEQQAALAQAKAWGVANRVEYLTQAEPPLTLEDHSVEAVISFGGLALWPRPLEILNELARVLKVEGEFFLGAPRRDAPAWRKWLAGQKDQTLPGTDTDRVRRLVFQARLDRAVTEVRGTDVWILRKAH